jgi:hypothetical protein
MAAATPATLVALTKKVLATIQRMEAKPGTVPKSYHTESGALYTACMAYPYMPLSGNGVIWAKVVEALGPSKERNAASAAAGVAMALFQFSPPRAQQALDQGVMQALIADVTRPGFSMAASAVAALIAAVPGDAAAAAFEAGAAPALAGALHKVREGTDDVRQTLMCDAMGALQQIIGGPMGPSDIERLATPAFVADLVHCLGRQHRLDTRTAAARLLAKLVKNSQALREGAAADGGAAACGAAPGGAAGGEAAADALADGGPPPSATPALEGALVNLVEDLGTAPHLTDQDACRALECVIAVFLTREDAGAVLGRSEGFYRGLVAVLTMKPTEAADYRHYTSAVACAVQAIGLSFTATATAAATAMAAAMAMAPRLTVALQVCRQRLQARLGEAAQLQDRAAAASVLALLESSISTFCELLNQAAASASGPRSSSGGGGSSGGGRRVKVCAQCGRSKKTDGAQLRPCSGCRGLREHDVLYCSVSGCRGCCVEGGEVCTRWDDGTDACMSSSQIAPSSSFTRFLRSALPGHQAACQAAHWRGGHKQECKQAQRRAAGGGRPVAGMDDVESGAVDQGSDGV